MSDENLKLSRISRFWIRCVVPPHLRDSAPVEWEEVYRGIRRDKGKGRADLWLLGQGLMTLRDIRLNDVKGGLLMLGVLKTRLLRPFRRKALYTWVNTAGLAVGLCTAMLITLWIDGETGYEKMHVKRDRIYRIVEHIQFADQQISRYAMIPDLVAPALQERFPEVVSAVRYRPGGDVGLQVQEKNFRNWRVSMADPGFFDLFSFSMVSGNTGTLLAQPNSLVITASAALGLFGTADVMGRSLEIIGEGLFQITGIVEKLPGCTHLQFDLMVPFAEGRRMGVPSQQFLFYETFVELNSQADAVLFEQKIRRIFREIAPDAPADVTMKLQSLNDIHLHSRFDIDVEGHGSAEQVQMLALVAALIILIATVNFINLSTARAAKRAREVGLRKTLGSTRQVLIIQLMGEAFFNVFLAGLLGMLLAGAFLPWMNGLIGSQLVLNGLFTFSMLGKICLIMVITSLGAGFYPAWVLSSFSPIQSLRLGRLTGGQRHGFRWALVVIQFVLSAGLWAMTWIVKEQAAYCSDRSSGYQRAAILALPLEEEAGRQRALLIQTFLSMPQVQAVSAVSEMPVNLSRGTDYLDWDGKDPGDVHLFSLLFCDAEAAHTMGLEMKDGRFFSEAREADRSCYVLNETAVEAMGMDHPVGKRFSMWEREGTIIGVVRDFHFQSLHQPVQPLILKLDPGRTESLLVRLKQNAGPESLASLAAGWKNVLTDVPFEPRFLESEFNHLHDGDRRFGVIFSAFSTLALAVSGLGLLGLAAYTAEQRTREMGIRRVLGASGCGLFHLMTREFVLGILIANLLAAPLAFWAGSRWLERFAYRIDIGASPFLLALGLSLGLAFLVTAGQAMKLLRLNPVKTLRCE